MDWPSKSAHTDYLGHSLTITTFRYAEKKFKRDGITLMTSHHVERVESVSTEYHRSLSPLVSPAETTHAGRREECSSRRREKVCMPYTVDLLVKAHKLVSSPIRSPCLVDWTCSEPSHRDNQSGGIQKAPKDWKVSSSTSRGTPVDLTPNQLIHRR